MTNPEFAAIIFGLASALSWGAGDFCGGVATKRSAVFSVVVVSQIVGASCLILLALATGETMPSTAALLWGAAAGLCGAVGIVALYRGLALGRMGVVAPVSGIVTAGLPVLVGIALDGLPDPWQIAGILLAFPAVWLVSSTSGAQRPAAKQDLGLALLAGVGFAGFLIFVNRASAGGLLWPLVAARFSSILMLSVVALVARRTLKPTPGIMPVVFLTGILEVGGNALFALASQVGRLDISAVLAALYPGATVLLAWLILKEPVARRQLLGVLAALAAVALIAL